jgi:hypothetical protein
VYRVIPGDATSVLRFHCPNDPEDGTSESCVGSVTPVGVFVPYPSRTSANRITLKMYPMSTDRMAAGRQPAEHLKHVEPDISEVML